MDRLTTESWRNLDPWECCGQDEYCKRGCHDPGGCNNGCPVPKQYVRLAKYEDMKLLPEEIKAILGDGGVGLAIRNRDLKADNAKLNAALSAIRQELEKRLGQVNKLQKLFEAMAKPAAGVRMSGIPLDKKLRLIDDYLTEDGRINEEWAAMVREYRNMLTAQPPGPEVQKHE